MEIVNIEAVIFRRMSAALEKLVSKLQSENRTDRSHGLEEWLDYQDVCQILDISPSKLLILRKNGAIAYSRIDRKIFYKWEDIRFIPIEPLFVTVGDVVYICGFKVKRLGTFMVTANSTFIFADDQPATKIVKPEETTTSAEPINPEIV